MSQDPYAKQKLFVKIAGIVCALFIAFVAYTYYTTSDEQKQQFNNDMNAIEQRK